MIDIQKIQELLRKEHLDGWLFSDFHGHDFITREFLELSGRKCTRRLFYYIPAEGEPVKLLSSIEPLLLDHLPGKKHLYQGRAGQTAALSALLAPGKRVACQYSPKGNVPTVSSMDAGLIEALRELSVEVVSSGDLLQHFGAILTKEQVESHRRAGIIIHRILDGAFAWIRGELDRGIAIDEWAMLQKMRELIAAEPIHMDSPPFFGINEHASDPGYEPSPEGSAPIREGDRLIIDIAGRLPEEDAVYYDISWCMNIGPDIDPAYQRLFDTVRTVQAEIFHFIRKRLENREEIRGWEADSFAREQFRALGMEQYLKHRTGHSIGHSCHGIGANLDDFETHDERLLLPGTLFSVEPGLYTEKYGVRLEYDVYITPQRKLKVYGPVQDKILIV